MDQESRREIERTQSFRRRPSARWLVLNPKGALLLFRFEHRQGRKTGQNYWATPGGSLKPRESFASGAVRTLYEETGIVVAQAGPMVAARRFSTALPDGEQVLADERYFLVELTEDPVLGGERWSMRDSKIMTSYRWWSATALGECQESIAPHDLLDMMRSTGHW